MHLRPTAAAGLWPLDGDITCWEMWARLLNASPSSLSRHKLKCCRLLGADPGLRGLSQSEAGVGGATRYWASLVENFPVTSRIPDGKVQTVQLQQINPNTKNAVWWNQTAGLLNTPINSRLCLWPISPDNQSERGFSCRVSVCEIKPQQWSQIQLLTKLCLTQYECVHWIN